MRKKIFTITIIIILSIFVSYLTVFYGACKIAPCTIIESVEKAGFPFRVEKNGFMIFGDILFYFLIFLSLYERKKVMWKSFRTFLIAAFFVSLSLTFSTIFLYRETFCSGGSSIGGCFPSYSSGWPYRFLGSSYNDTNFDIYSFIIDLSFYITILIMLYFVRSLLLKKAKKK